jgi:hypothetical protein
MKYELSSLEIGIYDMEGFKNSKIFSRMPPLGEKYHRFGTIQTRLE